MADTSVEVASEEWGELMTFVYGNEFVRLSDINGRNVFYGVVAEESYSFLGDKIGLTQDSHFLDFHRVST